MIGALTTCALVWAFVATGNAVSTKMDFGDDSETSATSNTSKVDDEEVEVKHTIIVSTKLRNNNNNRKGIHNLDDGSSFHGNDNFNTHKTDDSSEVSVIAGNKAVDSTIIRTPDTRIKAVSPKRYPDSIIINRNIRDDYDLYSNAVTRSGQWKPSNFYNNINYRWDQGEIQNYNEGRRNEDGYRGSVKYHRRISNDGIKDFYCQKCRELTYGEGVRMCSQQKSGIFYRESTTQKVKVDGKLAKLN